MTQTACPLAVADAARPPSGPDGVEIGEPADPPSQRDEITMRTVQNLAGATVTVCEGYNWPRLQCAGCALDIVAATWDYGSFAAVWHAGRCDSPTGEYSCDPQSGFNNFDCAVAYLLDIGRTLRLADLDKFVDRTDTALVRHLVVSALLALAAQPIPSPGAEFVLERVVNQLGGIEALRQATPTATLAALSPAAIEPTIPNN